MPSRSGSHADAMSPPTTTSRGLRTTQMPASARPTARPASAITRRAPASPASRERDNVRGRQIRPVAVAERPDDRRGARDRLQAAAPAAAADEAARLDDDVAELAGGAGVALVEAPAEDQPGADAGRQHHVDEVVHAAACAERRLRERAEVRVVADVHGECRAGGAAPPRRRARTSPGRSSARQLARAAADRGRERGADPDDPRRARARPRRSRRSPSPPPRRAPRPALSSTSSL